ncbi:type V CRISPR-associated protein Cas12c [Undibacterium oligocarboniphilum]|uniref:Type V CRISPR-associated protein Cas12c n=2 Tax=Undibacterium oligocarboniphilum TaxID=666702 RepID=A0A850QNX9_9BURK|nr:type V CRISPR-associated protein Cas12c [Undibacterium oligocarboniphilum]NVO79375.1 type V CRISPR-associated protein Cas12c [Undibacterium oligocarboniphilum]
MQVETNAKIKLHQSRNSGAQARQWKGEIALLAKANKPSMRTLQFPLDITDFVGIDQNELGQLYNVVEGTQPGSLFHFFSTLHICGFQFFAAAGDATTFRQLKIFDDKNWHNTFCRVSGLSIDNFIPSQLYSSLQKGVRSTGGKDVSFTPNVIANEMAKRICTKSLQNSKGEDNYPQEVVAFFTELGDSIAQSCTSWKALNDNPVLGMQSMDALFKAKGWQLPSLASKALQLVDTEPAGATIAFNGNVLPAGEYPIQSVFAIIAARKPDEINLKSWVQAESVTPNASALSWIFNKGIAYFSETNLDQILSDFDIADNFRSNIALVKSAATSIPPINQLGQKHYGGFRANFGGKVTSWVANYHTRLEELTQILEGIHRIELPADLVSEPAERFFKGMDITAHNLTDLCSHILTQSESAKAMLQTISGNIVMPVDEACNGIVRLSNDIDTLHGQLSILKTNIEREKDIALANSDSSLLALTTACAFEIPKWLRALPKLNQFSGGNPDVAKELATKVSTFNVLWQDWHQNSQRLFDYAGADCDAYQRVAEREAMHLHIINPKFHEPRGDRRARRNILNRIGRSIQNCSEKTKHALVVALKAIDVFENPSLLNTWIFNQKGRVYASVFDKSRHGTYPLKDGPLMGTDWLQWLSDVIDDMEIQSQDDIEDVLTLKKALHALRCSGLPAIDYPTELLTPMVSQLTAYVEIPATVSISLKNASVPVSIVQKILNLYSSAVSGLIFPLLRKQFIIKMRFALGGDNALMYVPKDKEWSFPAQYLKSDQPIGIAARILQASALQTAKPVTMLNRLQKDDVPLEALKAWMVQAPHDWYYSPKLGNEPAIHGLRVSKTNGSFHAFKQETGYRLIGSPTYKSVLERTLIDQTVMSDMSFIVTQHYQQQVTWNNNQLRVTAHQDNMTAMVSIPVTETRPAKPASESFYDHIVSIDLGEFGIGYACHHIRSKKLIDSGYQSIASIRRLIKKTWSYEHRPNIRQKFQSKFNMNLSSVRENVVGDICHHINRICQYYNAFPVLESSIGDTGNKQLNSVYESVLNRYLYSGTSMHQMDRKQFWLGAETWHHPYLLTQEYKEGKPTGKYKPMNLFPGASTSGKGTSQRCSCCGRNPYDLLAQYKDTDKLSVLNGKLTIDGLVMQLRERNPDGQQHHAAKQQNKRLSPVSLVSSGNYTIKELRRMLKTSLRYAPESMQAKGSTVSKYHCVFELCGQKIHADQNSSINIGDKFLSEKTLASA